MHPKAIWLAPIVSALLLVVSGQTLISSITYEDCAVSVPGDPCVLSKANSARDGNSWDWKQFNAAPCALSDDGSQVLVSDYLGLTLRSSSDLTSLDSRVALNCPSVLISRHQYGGNYLMTTSSESAMNPGYGACFCQQAGNCKQRQVEISGDINFNFTYTPSGEGMSRHVYTVATDIVQAPMVLYDCSTNSSMERWLNPPAGAVLFTPTSVGRNCPNDFTQTISKFAARLGYRALLRGKIGVVAWPNSWYQWEVPDIFVLNVHENDAIVLNTAFKFGNESLYVSFGPSYLAPGTIQADEPNGLATVNSSGTVTPDSSVFKNSILIEEGLYGGSSSVVWAVVLDGNSKRVQRIDYTNPSAPEVINLQAEGPMIYRELTCPWINQQLQVFNWTVSCPILDETKIPFEHSMSLAGMETNTKAVAFFTDAGRNFVINSYFANLPCKGCLSYGGYVPFYNIDMWDITNLTAPVLADRISNSNIDKEYAGMMSFAYGKLYYSNFSSSLTGTFVVDVSATTKLDNIRTHSYTIFPHSGSADAIPFERYLWDANTLVINWGKDGTVFYSIDATGITGVVQQIPTTSNTNSIGGAIYSCGSGVQFVRDNAVNSEGVNGVFSFVSVESFDLSSGSSTTSSSGAGSGSSTTTTSTSSSGGLGTSTTSTATTGTVPSNSPSRSPSASTPACVTPDVCKFDCSRPADPTKFPKPSVQPSKLPAASKVPEPEYFTIELTYESTAAECGAAGPDCCDVREWLGDDAVAASFFLCSSDSTTKNRAPEYDDKAATCTIFLAAQEGTDAGKITQSEFDAALATLETSFSTLCPTNLKNCQITDKSGQSIKSILGSAASVVASMVVIFATLLLVL